MRAVPGKIFASLLLSLTVLVSCGPVRDRRTLDELEALMPERPDSALAVLGEVKLMTVEEPHIVTNENYLQIFVELPKLAEVAPERMSQGELFLDAMRNLQDWDTRPAAYGDKSLDRLFAESSYQSLTDDEQAKHDKEMTTEQDYIQIVAYEKSLSFKEGQEAGLAKGREEGSELTRLETAKKLKAAGIALELIASCTGLPIERVERL